MVALYVSLNIFFVYLLTYPTLLVSEFPITIILKSPLNEDLLSLTKIFGIELNDLHLKNAFDILITLDASHFEIFGRDNSYF